MNVAYCTHLFSWPTTFFVRYETLQMTHQSADLSIIKPLPIDLSHLQEVLADCTVGHTIEYYKSVPSTMPLAHQLANTTSTRSGTMILAGEQSAGRGRQARRWETPPDQALLMSLILKAPLPIPIHEIPMAAGLAAVDAIVSCYPLLQNEIALKWPNDLLVGRDPASTRKLGGILVESAFYGAEVSHVIVGMGLNVSQTMDHLPPPQPGAIAPTSLYHSLSTLQSGTVAGGTAPPPITSAMLDRTTLLIALSQAWATLLTTSQKQTIRKRWRAKLGTLGQQVTIHEGPDLPAAHNLQLAGEAIDVTEEGHLLVRDAMGTLHTVTAGDVSVRMATTLQSG